ncbi:hypothetical protein MAR_006819 [Mya arenaria]|uniref:Uncharacterized protein n=1 Tax=Mya arenaria TaxID=6604 RepID=A0ABY7DE50_MYAAR|nr:hypothetical protein MAR_006819 [Mya arenaria]
MTITCVKVDSENVEAPKNSAKKNNTSSPVPHTMEREKISDCQTEEQKDYISLFVRTDIFGRKGNTCKR